MGGDDSCLGNGAKMLGEIYALVQELIIENPISNAEGMAAPASGRQAQHANGVSDVRLAAFESFVKKEYSFKLNEV